MRAGAISGAGIGTVIGRGAMGAKEPSPATWPMTGHDVEDTRSQPDEKIIKRSTVDQLVPTWTFQTGGDVSATPAVDVEQDESGGHRTVVYFPDWGGNLWKLDPDSKEIV